MRKPIVTLLTLTMLSLIALYAQIMPTRQIEEILAKLDSSRVSLRYDCTLQQPAGLRLNGTLILQGNCYRASGNGMEIYCDGKTRWTVDPEEKEVYIETSGGTKEILNGENTLKSLSINDIKYIPLSNDLRDFRFDTSGLGSDWVVTDLREE